MVPGMATALRGASNPVPACWHGGCGVWVMPGVWGLLRTPPSGSAQARDTAPARRALAVPGRAPVSPVAPTGPGFSLLGEEPTLGQAGARGAQEHPRNHSTASAFPKPIHCPASEPFKPTPALGTGGSAPVGQSTAAQATSPGHQGRDPPALQPTGTPWALPACCPWALGQPWHSPGTASPSTGLQSHWKAEGGGKPQVQAQAPREEQLQQKAWPSHHQRSYSAINGCFPF